MAPPPPQHRSGGRWSTVATVILHVSRHPGLGHGPSPIPHANALLGGTHRDEGRALSVKGEGGDPPHVLVARLEKEAVLLGQGPHAELGVLAARGQLLPR